MRITSAQMPSVAEVMRTTRAKHFENPINLTKDIERRDTYEKQNPSSRIENIMYDHDGNLLNMPENGKVQIGEYVNGEGELQKLHEGLREMKPLTEEQITLMKGTSKIEQEIAKRIMNAKIKMSNALNRGGKPDTLEELFNMYDKQFGTDSTKEMDEFKKLGRVSNIISAMRHALFNAGYNDQGGKDIMEYSDGSFSRADFDYVMGMGEQYDYESNSFRDKNCIKNAGSDVNSDLKDIAIGLLW